MIIQTQTKEEILIENLERAIRNLKSKRDGFIGSLKDRETMANSQGFREGLDWAIESIETAINNTKNTDD